MQRLESSHSVVPFERGRIEAIGTLESASATCWQPVSGTVCDDKWHWEESLRKDGLGSVAYKHD